MRQTGRYLKWKQVQTNLVAESSFIVLVSKIADPVGPESKTRSERKQNEQHRVQTIVSLCEIEKIERHRTLNYLTGQNKIISPLYELMTKIMKS